MTHASIAANFSKSLAPHVRWMTKSLGPVRHTRGPDRVPSSDVLPSPHVCRVTERNIDIGVIQGMGHFPPRLRIYIKQRTASVIIFMSDIVLSDSSTWP